VTGTDGSIQGTATLTVNAGPLASISLSPATASVSAGGSQGYVATGVDGYGNSLGTVTGSTTFTIAPDGSCTAANCSATVAGAHTVTGTDGSFTVWAPATHRDGDGRLLPGDRHPDHHRRPPGLDLAVTGHRLGERRGGPDLRGDGRRRLRQLPRDGDGIDHLHHQP
jgi:hypothetical protein